MGEDGVGMKSKTVTVEADGVCSIKGRSALKLQEAEGPKGKSKASHAATPPDEPQDASTTMSHSHTSGLSAGEAPTAISQTKKQKEAPSAAPATSDAKKDPEKKLTVHFDREKVRCGREVILHATSEKIDNGTPVKWEIKQEGKTAQSVDGAINATSAHTTWNSKAQTDKRPEPPFSLIGSAAGLTVSATKDVTLKKYEDNRTRGEDNSLLLR